MEKFKITKLDQIFILFSGIFLPLINLRIDLLGFTLSFYMISIIIGYFFILIKKPPLKILYIEKNEILIFLFLFTYFVSIFYSENLTIGILRFIKLVFVILFYFFTVTIIVEKKFYLPNIIKWIKMSLFIFMIYLGYIYFFVFNRTFIGLNSKIATGTGKNSLAFMVAILIPFFLNSFFEDKKNIKFSLKYMELFASLIIVLLAISIQSRGLFLVILFYFFILLLTEIKNKKFYFKIFLSIILIFLVVFLFLSEELKSDLFFRFSVIFRLFEQNVYLEDLSNIRYDLIKRSIELFSASPLIGVGAGNFMYFGQGSFYISHNDYLLVLSEQGIIGLIIFLLVLFSFIKSAFFNLKKEKNYINKSLLMSVLGLSLYLFFINAYDNILVWTLFAFIKGTKINIHKNQKGDFQ